MTQINTTSNTSILITPITVPIIYGTASIPVDMKDLNTDYKWSVFIKHPFNESLKPYVKSVTFFLHESFEAPIRRVTEEPFMLLETGWGEFNI